jgi:hypothetical protein
VYIAFILFKHLYISANNTDPDFVCFPLDFSTLCKYWHGKSRARQFYPVVKHKHARGTLFFLFGQGKRSVWVADEKVVAHSGSQSERYTLICRRAKATSLESFSPARSLTRSSSCMRLDAVCVLYNFLDGCRRAITSGQKHHVFAPCSTVCKSNWVVEGVYKKIMCIKGL